MEGWVKFRASESDIRIWKQAAATKGLSAWFRDLAMAEVRKHGGGPGPGSRPPAIVLSETVEVEKPPSGVLGEQSSALESQPEPIHETCRHGLVNCRVCGYGAFR